MSEATRTVIEEFPILGKTLTPGIPFRIRGIRQTFIFQRVVILNGSSWVECIGPKHEARAFDLDRISKVLPMPKDKR